jgi:hypothetical protein
MDVPQVDAPIAVRLADSGSLFELWEGPDNATMRLDWTRKGAVRFTVSGHGNAGFAAPAIARWDAARRSGSRPVNLIDFWDMATYDSGLRVQCTAWGVKHRADADFFVCTRSRIVLMGLAVANLATGGLLKVHEKRPEFDALCVKHGLPSRIK